MVPPKTLRRKLQKKAKRKGWVDCPLCLANRGIHTRYKVGPSGGNIITRLCRCGWRGIMYWKGRVAER